MKLVETSVFVSVPKCYRFSRPISEVRIISEKQAHRNTLLSDAASAERSKTTQRKRVELEARAAFFANITL